MKRRKNGFIALRPKMAEVRRKREGFQGRLAPPRATSATESALGLRPRRALSSAQLHPEWSTINSPLNFFSANGNYPLNSVSHTRGSLQCFPVRTLHNGPYSVCR